jgi:hypothetical protein
MYTTATIPLPNVDVNNPPPNPSTSNAPFPISFPIANISGNLGTGCFFCNSSNSADEFSVQPGKTYLFEYGASVDSTSGRDDFYIWLSDLLAPAPSPPGWSGDGTTYYGGANLNPLPGSVICLSRNTSLASTYIPLSGSYTYTVPSTYPSNGLIALVAVAVGDSNGFLSTRTAQQLVNGVSAYMGAVQLT